MIASAPEIEYYRSQFCNFRAGLPGYQHLWVEALRNRAMERFSHMGFPSVRDEDWKYTDVAPIARRPFQIAAPTDELPAAISLRRWIISDLPCHRLVFINGHHMPALSGSDEDDEGLEVCSLARELSANPASLRQTFEQVYDESAAFDLMNAALMSDGAVIRIKDDATIRLPVHLIFISRGQTQPLTVNTRNLIAAGRNSRVNVIESFVSDDDSANFSNTVSNILALAGAHIEHFKIQTENLKSYHIGRLNVQQHARTTLRSYSIALGGRLARSDINIALVGEYAGTELLGVYMASGRQHIDHHTRVDHVSPECKSDELYKGIIDGHGRAVFNGKVVVHPDAQQSDARQANHNLLLSENGEVDTKPELEIYADDVKCSHGATVGQLDQDALFYLRARGIEMDTATQLLTHAFLKELITTIDIPELQAWVSRAITENLPQSGAVGDMP